MTKITSVALPVFISIFFLCSAPARDKAANEPPAVPAANETLWLAPLTDRSGISDNIALPKDSVQRAILSGHFDDIHHKLLTEFRRCEKYGLYRMVDDSLQSTIRVYVSLERTIPARDTLFIPLVVIASAPAEGGRWQFDLTMATSAPVPATEDDPFHHAGRLIVNLGNDFPYRQIVYPFYK